MVSNIKATKWPTNRWLGISFASLASAIALMPSPAAAQWLNLGPDELTSTYESRRPVRGYSGWMRYGNRDYYCDYIRTPKRRCRTDRRGRQRCRVVGWTLNQRCY